MVLQQGDNLPAAPRIDCYAHTVPGASEAEWEPLERHLTAVAERAAEFASAFGAADWGRFAGAWHDVGKYSAAFQAYLREAECDPHQADFLTRVDHSTAGAQHAAERLGKLGHLLSHVIAGHHSGLLDTTGAGACLDRRLVKPIEPWDSAPRALLDRGAPQLPPYLNRALGQKCPHTVAFFTRMVFSALVDADFLETEAFMSPAKAAERPQWPTDVLARMEGAVEANLARFGPPETEVDLRRAEVSEACRAAAPRSPGIFSLTVPTGGGKTLASLRFALRHAREHGLRRVVYVAPFTSIIEQNAQVYRDVFSGLVDAGIPDPVLEHHSNVDLGPEHETAIARLAAENWDAPLVVTTAVQFYESLYANRTSRCRKLHRLARSVIILDEAQAIPVDYLHPCLRALGVLTESFGATVVLCTATQPAVHQRPEFPIGLSVSEGREIVPDPPTLFHALRRVRVRVAGRLPDEDLVARIREHEQVLCIVNTRRHARRLFDLLGPETGHYHLSALMCAQHRTEVIQAIRKLLDQDAPCRVVSTQLIEAGVDIDFPAVYRALAGLDAVAQAAGRCNRNGKRPEGVTTVFEPEEPEAAPFVAATVSSARPLLEKYDDLLGLDAIEHYFKLHYWEQQRPGRWKGPWDRKGILHEFRLEGRDRLPFRFNFATAAREFRLIEDGGQVIYIPWGKRGKALCAELRNESAPGPRLLRSLQRFTVQIPEHAWQRHQRAMPVEALHDRYPVLIDTDRSYSNRTGLDVDMDLSTYLVS